MFSVVYLEQIKQGSVNAAVVAAGEMPQNANNRFEFRRIAALFVRFVLTEVFEAARQDPGYDSRGKTTAYVRDYPIEIRRMFNRRVWKQSVPVELNLGRVF